MQIDVQTTLAGSVSAGVTTGMSLNTGGTGTYSGQYSYDQWNQSALPTDVNGNTINIDPGLGKPVQFGIFVTVALAGSGASIQFQLVNSTDAAESSSVTVLNQGRAWTMTAINALNGSTGLGLVEVLTLPSQDVQRYLEFQYVVTGAALSAGAVFVAQVIDPPTSLPVQ